MSDSEDKPQCKYGAKCYRKNPQHWKEFSHPGDLKITEKVRLQKVKDDDPPKKKTKINDFFQAPSTKKTDLEDDKDSNPEKEKCTKNQEEDKTETGGNDTTVEMPDSPKDICTNIKEKFLMEMPQDFYDFWEFAKSVNIKEPSDAFLNSLGLQLVGPYDILAGKSRKQNSQGKKPCYLLHWRYYYDPPEFMTVLRGDDESQFHMGYFRDDPKEMPVFVASNAARDNGVISARGENIFAAVNWYIDDKIQKNKSLKAKLVKLKQDLTDYAKKKDYSLELRTKAMKARDKKSVCKTFHGAGMVVPVDPETEVGYRPVPEDPADLKRMFKKIKESKTEDEKNTAFDPLMEILMLVQFANDECDYGEGLELGLDLFAYGGDVFNSTIRNLLPLAYQLLGRMEYKQIIEAHLKDRRHTTDLDQLK